MSSGGKASNAPASNVMVAEEKMSEALNEFTKKVDEMKLTELQSKKQLSVLLDDYNRLQYQVSSEEQHLSALQMEGNELTRKNTELLVKHKSSMLANECDGKQRLAELEHAHRQVEANIAHLQNSFKIEEEAIQAHRAKLLDGIRRLSCECEAEKTRLDNVHGKVDVQLKEYDNVVANKAKLVRQEMEKLNAQLVAADVTYKEKLATLLSHQKREEAELARLEELCNRKTAELARIADILGKESANLELELHKQQERNNEVRRDTTEGERQLNSMNVRNHAAQKELETAQANLAKLAAEYGNMQGKFHSVLREIDENQKRLEVIEISRTSFHKQMLENEKELENMRNKYNMEHDKQNIDLNNLRADKDSKAQILMREQHDMENTKSELLRNFSSEREKYAAKTVQIKEEYNKAQAQMENERGKMQKMKHDQDKERLLLSRKFEIEKKANDEKIHSLQNTYSIKEKEVQDLLGQLQKKQLQAKELESATIAKNEKAVQDSELKIREAQQKGADADVKCRNYDAMIASKKTEFEKYVRSLDAEMAQCVKNQQAKLQAMMDNLNTREKACTDRIRELNGEIKQLSGQNQLEKTKLKQLQGDVDPLEAHSKSLRGSIDKLQADLDVILKNIDQQTKYNQQLLSQNRDLSAQVKQKEEKVTLLNQKALALQADVDQLTVRRTDQQGMIPVETAKLKDLQEKNKTLSKSVDVLKGDSRALNEDMIKQKQEFEQMRLNETSIIERLKREQIELREKFKADMDIEHSKLHEVVLRIEALRKELQTLRKEEVTLKQSLLKLESSELTQHERMYQEKLSQIHTVQEKEEVKVDMHSNNERR